MWRSGRQQMVTLSTAEAELLAMIDGAIAMKGIEALLSDLGQHVEEKVIASDSTAALSISTGSTSWRTRHLKIKANWLQEQIQHGQLTTRHCPGERQLADILTKALSSARIASLLQLWRVGETRDTPLLRPQGLRCLPEHWWQWFVVYLWCQCVLLTPQRRSQDILVFKWTGIWQE